MTIFSEQINIYHHHATLNVSEMCVCVCVRCCVCVCVTHTDVCMCVCQVLVDAGASLERSGAALSVMNVVLAGTLCIYVSMCLSVCLSQQS
jgi:hypothetical protein